MHATNKRSPWPRRAAVALAAAGLASAATRLRPAPTPADLVRVRDLAPLAGPQGSEAALWVLDLQTEAGPRRLHRVRWWLGERHLVGCLDDGDGRDARPLGAPCGQAAVAFRVIERYDVPTCVACDERTSLCPVLMSTERPWHQREFAVIDWTRDVLAPPSGALRRTLWPLVGPTSGRIEWLSMQRTPRGLGRAFARRVADTASAPPRRLRAPPWWFHGPAATRRPRRGPSSPDAAM